MTNNSNTNTYKAYTTADCPSCCNTCSIQSTLFCLGLSVPFLFLSLTEPWDEIILTSQDDNSTSTSISTDEVLIDNDKLIDYYNYYTESGCNWFWNGLFWFLAFFYPFFKFVIQVVCMFVMYQMDSNDNTLVAEESSSLHYYWKDKLVGFVHLNVFYLGSLVYKLTQAVLYITSFQFLAFAIGFHADLETEPPLQAPVKAGLYYFITTSQLCCDQIRTTFSRKRLMESMQNLL